MCAVHLRFNFSSKLNLHKRRLVHEVGEENKLVHKIVGEGKEKHIMLKKPGGNNVKDSNAASAIEGEDVTDKTEDQEEKKNKALAAGQGKVASNSCSMAVPSQNIELTCNTAMVSIEEEGAATLGGDYTLCLTDSMADVHECGQEARRVATQQITSSFCDGVSGNSGNIPQLDGETDVDRFVALDMLKEILNNLLKQKYDRFEVLTLLDKFEVDIHGETMFSRQQYCLQKVILKCIIREDPSELYPRLLRETVTLCNFQKTTGYSCCLSGCLFHSDRHKSYIKHLQKTHFSCERLSCKFNNKCPRDFSSIGLLIEHIKQSHAEVPPTITAPINQSNSVNIACKCDNMRCGGRQFANIKLLMTHINVEHADEPRQCIFEECNQKFSANAVSRNHFRLKHTNLNKLKLKNKHLVEEVLISDQVEIPMGMEVTQEEELGGNYDEVYDQNDLEFLEANIQESIGLDDGDYIFKAYADFLNRMCHEKFVPHRTMQLIASEYLTQSLKSNEVKEIKLRDSLGKLPGVTEDMIEKIVNDVLGEDELMKAQKQLNSEYKLKKYIQEQFQYCSPIEIVLNQPEVDQGLPKDCFHYVPVTESFRLLMEDDSYIEMQEKVRGEEHRGEAGVLRDVKDGSAYRNIEYFKRNPDAMCAIFYSDALEVVNPLASARGRHKVVQIFYTLGDIPKDQRSQTDRMQVAMIVREKLIKKYGLGLIYKPLIDDLRKLEAGILIETPVPKLVKCGVLLHAGDNLESHTVGGFSMSFSSRDVCRFCHLQHSQLKENIHDFDGEEAHKYWTTTEYDNICDGIEAEEDDIDMGTYAARELNVAELEEHLFDEVPEPSLEEDEIEETVEDNFEDEEAEDNGKTYGLRHRCGGILLTMNAFLPFGSKYSYIPKISFIGWLEVP